MTDRLGLAAYLFAVVTVTLVHQPAWLACGLLVAVGGGAVQGQVHAGRPGVLGLLHWHHRACPSRGR